MDTIFVLQHDSEYTKFWSNELGWTSLEASDKYFGSELFVPK